MKLPENFISCDWGTSKLRLRKLEAKSGNVLSLHVSERGIKECFDIFKKQNALDQKEFFTLTLLEELEKSGIKESEETLIVASGMLSSSLGLEEMVYAPLPVSFEGENLVSKVITLDDKKSLVLISGVCSQSNVMRGEETQAIGLAEFLPRHGRGILLLPGTHSKHITFKSGQFTDISTFMTGELFDLLVNKSILQASIEPVDWNRSRESIYLKGVVKGVEDPLGSSLFPIRAINLLNKNSPKDNYFYLSGLLIGAELATFKDNNDTIYLGASGLFSELYRTALEAFLPLDRIVRFDNRLVDKALLAGQKKILQTYE